MKTKSLVRKRIWEVDCLSMDACLAASYDWRELANMLKSVSLYLDFKQPDHVLEMRVQAVAHSQCHGENPFSLRVEMLLNLLYNDTVCEIESMEHREIYYYVMGFDFKKRAPLAGLFWALGSDPREELDYVRRFLHQRYQVISIRERKGVF